MYHRGNHHTGVKEARFGEIKCDNFCKEEGEAKTGFFGEGGGCNGKERGIDGGSKGREVTAKGK